MDDYVLVFLNHAKLAIKCLSRHAIKGLIQSSVYRQYRNKLILYTAKTKCFNNFFGKY